MLHQIMHFHHAVTDKTHKISREIQYSYQYTLQNNNNMHEIQHKIWYVKWLWKYSTLASKNNKAIICTYFNADLGGTDQ